MKGICISHRPYLIKNPGLAHKKAGGGGEMGVGVGGVFNFHMLLALEGLSHPGGRYGVTALGSNGCRWGNCTCLLDKTAEGGDRSHGLI